MLVQHRRVFVDGSRGLGGRSGQWLAPQLRLHHRVLHRVEEGQKEVGAFTGRVQFNRLD